MSVLVLTRKKNQTIVIGDQVEVTIIEIRGDQVRLGIAAPKSVSVHRLEVYEDIQQANREARSSGGGARLRSALEMINKG